MPMEESKIVIIKNGTEQIYYGFDRVIGACGYLFMFSKITDEFGPTTIKIRDEETE